MARSPLTRDRGQGNLTAPSRSLLWALALIGCAAAALTLYLALTNGHVHEPGLQGALFVWIILPYVFGGLIAWQRRPDSRLGPLMVIAGFGMFASSLAWANATVPATIGQAFDLVPAVIFLHVFLAFPSGRLEGRIERTLVASGYVAAIGLQLVEMMLGGLGPGNLLQIADEPHAAHVLQGIQLYAISAISLAGIAVLAARRRGAGRPLRRSSALLVDSFALALVMIAVLLVAGYNEWPSFETIRRATLLVIGIAPVAFLIGLLHARLARSAVADLFVELRVDPRPADLRDALARALRDPSLALAYWLPEYGTYADLDGRPIDLEDERGGRATTVIERDNGRIAALLHDPMLNDEPELLNGVRAAAGIALENAQLQAELRARLDELNGSRERIIEAGQKERQRLERNLHDGAQQRLIALSLQLGRLEEQTNGDRDASTGLERARREIALSLEELRDVARGIHPAVVSGHGLAVALESLAAGAPLPVRLTVELEGRLQERLEVAAYYVVSESLANVGKHARASSATVDVGRNNGQLVVEIVDDGIGGADTEHGSGLRGLADRVEALGGRLRIWTPLGGGTRVRAEIPCA